MSRGKPSNALRAKGVEKEEEEKQNQNRLTATNVELSVVNTLYTILKLQCQLLYVMSSILLTSFNHCRSYCANFFSTRSTLSSSNIWFFYGLRNYILLYISRISSLMSLVFPLVSMSRFHSHINVMKQLKYYILSIKTFFGLILDSKHCSKFPMFVKLYLFSKLCPFPLCMLFYIPIHKHVTCSHTVLSITISLLIRIDSLSVKF
jgi:hypothetical protein